MAVGNIRGRARLSASSPAAQAICDRCGFLYQLSDLRKQFQYGGKGLIDTGLLVCAQTCLDRPWDQLRALILPPDPVPHRNPRPDVLATPPATVGFPPPTSPGNQGWTQLILGAPVPGDYPTTKPAALDAVAAATGVPTPPFIADRSKTITQQDVTFTLMAANASRSWLLVYNPSGPQAQFSSGTAVWGAISNLIIGPGEAWFQATALGNGPCYTGALTAVGLYPEVELWAWENIVVPPAGLIALQSGLGFIGLQNGLGNIELE